jgi:hypothetical protein
VCSEPPASSARSRSWSTFSQLSAESALSTWVPWLGSAISRSRKRRLLSKRRALRPMRYRCR